MAHKFSNSLIDDLTTIKTLLLGYQRWNEDRYLSLTKELASGILQSNVINGTLRSSASWSIDYQEFDRSFSFFDRSIIVLKYPEQKTKMRRNLLKMLSDPDEVVRRRFENHIKELRKWST